jgi:GH15 family glucan-1,4-alpha-glucosidase
LVRSVVGVRGTVQLRCEFAPRFEFGLTTPHLRWDGTAVDAHAGPTRLRLTSPVSMDVDGGVAFATFTVAAGERVSFCLAHASAHAGGSPSTLDPEDALLETQRTWESWAEMHPGYDGAHAETVRASALVLQGLTYKPTGAVLAAATTSLPAKIGGDSNWDYRYSWLRDLSLTGQALWIAACPDEGTAYLRFLADAAGQPDDDARVQIVYAVDGRRELSEYELQHLSGYRGSSPVRVGNAAWKQSQLDVTGEVLDLAHRFADQLDADDGLSRQMLLWLAEEAATTWQSPDAGMWEARDDERHYVTSKVMCWVALDRAIDLADFFGDGADVERWRTVRDEIRARVLDEGWNDEVQAFTGAFGSEHLDASVLILPLVGFIDASDERMVATVRAVEEQLLRGGLVYRWDGDTNGFVLCTYWLVECLAMMGDLDRARSLFEEITARANDVGLFAEQIDPDTGEQTGNFPQAFSHVGLINAAWRLASVSEG